MNDEDYVLAKLDVPFTLENGDVIEEIEFIPYDELPVSEICKIIFPSNGNPVASTIAILERTARRIDGKPLHSSFFKSNKLKGKHITGLIALAQTGSVADPNDSETS